MILPRLRWGGGASREVWTRQLPLVEFGSAHGISLELMEWDPSDTPDSSY